MMTLQNDALQLVELNRQLIQTLGVLVEGNTEGGCRALEAYLVLRRGLRDRMLDESVILIEDTTAREILHKISSGESLDLDKVVRLLEEFTGVDLAVAEFDDAEMEKLGDELFYSWYSHHNYVAALAELRPLILQCDVSENVKHFVGEVKQCYAFQQYDAAIAMCRTLLEASARDVGERNGQPFRKGMYGRKLFGKVSTGPLRGKLGDLYDCLSEVSHGRKTVTPEGTRVLFRETLSAIEGLYGSPRP